VCAGLNLLAVAHRPVVTGGGGASKMAEIGIVSNQKIQDFQPSLRK